MKHRCKAEVSVDLVEEWGKDFESLWGRSEAAFSATTCEDVQKDTYEAFSDALSENTVAGGGVFG